MSRSLQVHANLPLPALAATTPPITQPNRHKYLLRRRAVAGQPSNLAAANRSRPYI